MKKLIVLAAFLSLGYVGANAQNAAPAQQAPKAVSKKEVSAKPNVKLEVTEATEATPAEPKAQAKKECSASEKKSCGTASGKKSCCSSKKPAAAPAKAPVQ